MLRIFVHILAVVLGVHLISPQATSAYANSDTLNGPYNAHIVEVIDGDTVRAQVDIWVGQSVTTLVRVAGIDAPEQRSKCKAEADKAKAAKDWLRMMTKDKVMRLRNVKNGKYAGRVIADLYTEDGQNIGDLAMARELVRLYSGGKRTGWC